jgi:cytidylate kinase
MKIITIDGPAGSGKSTIAKILATKLNFAYIDSGSLYRSFAYWFAKKNYPQDVSLEFFLENIKNFHVEYSWANNKANLILEGENITEEIRTENISKQASLFASNKMVRELITTMQKKIASQNNVVLEGRDAGTVVFPNADKKFFLTASLEERARRRGLEIENRPEVVAKVDFEKIKQDIKDRDFKDENRDISPLVKADDAIEIDTTGLTIHEVVDLLMEKIQ